MSVLLLVRNDPNLLDFTIVSHSLVLFWRNWRINPRSYPECLQYVKSLHLTDTYDVPSGIGILIMYMSICAEKRNHWWQSENTKNLWISYTNSLNMIILKKMLQTFCFIFYQIGRFFLTFWEVKKEYTENHNPKKTKTGLFFHQHMHSKCWSRKSWNAAFVL